jgi:hypothetical protein
VYIVFKGKNNSWSPFSSGIKGNVSSITYNEMHFSKALIPPTVLMAIRTIVYPHAKHRNSVE